VQTFDAASVGDAVREREFIDLTGRRFGKWSVIELWGFRESLRRDAHGQIVKSKRALWSCLCDCGVLKKKVFSNHLVSGKSKSCGCARLLANGKRISEWNRRRKAARCFTNA
jgi:hypothetical protein